MPQSVTKFIALLFLNLVTPKAVAKLWHLFNKPGSVLKELALYWNIFIAKNQKIIGANSAEISKLVDENFADFFLRHWRPGKIS